MAGEKEVDVVIIGAGPAGITAALYAKRKALSVRIFESKAAGGQTADAIWVENYTGMKKIEGIKLMQKMQEHLKDFDVEIDEAAEITGIKKTETGFEIDMENGEEKIAAKAVILCTGSKYKMLNVPGEKELYGKGLSYCATCEGPGFKDKVVAVVGGGNSGANAAIFFADICSKVYIVEFGEKAAYDSVYEKALKAQSKIEIILNTQVTVIEGKEKVEGIKTKNRATGEEKVVPVNGVFIYIGMQPRNDLAKQLGLELTEKGFIKVDTDNRTSLPGMFAAGDITGELAQTIVAAGSGAKAAVSAFEFIKGLK